MYSLLNGKKIYEKQEVDTLLVPIEANASEAITKASEVYDLATSAKATAEQAKTDVAAATQAALDAEEAVNGVRDTVAQALNTSMTAVNIADNARRTADEAKEMAEEAMSHTGGVDTLGIDWESLPHPDGTVNFAGVTVLDDITYYAYVHNAESESQLFVYYTTDDFKTINMCGDLSEIAVQLEAIIYAGFNVIKYNNKYYTALGTTIYESADGITWSEKTTLSVHMALPCLCVVNNTMYILTIISMTESGIEYKYYYTNDLITWSSTDTQAGNVMFNCAVVNNKYIYNMTLSMATSELSFSILDTTTKVFSTYTPAALQYYSMSYDEGINVLHKNVFGYNDYFAKFTLTLRHMIYLSDDGINWSPIIPEDQALPNTSLGYLAGPYDLNGLQTLFYYSPNNDSAQSSYVQRIVQLVNGQWVVTRGSVIHDIKDTNELILFATVPPVKYKNCLLSICSVPNVTNAIKGVSVIRSTDDIQFITSSTDIVDTDDYDTFNCINNKLLGVIKDDTFNWCVRSANTVSEFLTATAQKIYSNDSIDNSDVTKPITLDVCVYKNNKYIITYNMMRAIISRS